MIISKLSAGKNIPEEINVIIEIPMNSDPIKYEFDKESNAIFVDRFIPVSMIYPCNYGFVPHTLSGDGDPIDVLVICSYPVIPGSVIKCRPVGVLLMEDESGEDEKILAVPISKVDIAMDKINKPEDLGDILLRKIVHFFEHYKDLEKNKWVKVLGWDDDKKAKKLILEAVERSISQS